MFVVVLVVVVLVVVVVEFFDAPELFGWLEPLS